MTATTSPDTESALLAAIVANTEDDVVRLVYADYLDERADEYDPRAEFIRLQCRLASFHPRAAAIMYHEQEQLGGRLQRGQCQPPCVICDLRRRERELLDWFCKEDLAVEFGLSPHETLRPIEGGLIAVAPQIELRFSRGFVAHVTASYETLFGGECGRCGGCGHQDAHCEVTCRLCSGNGRTPGIAADLFRAQPVQSVTLAGVEPVVGEEATIGWIRENPAGLDIPDSTNRPDVIPADLFDLLDGKLVVDGVTWRSYESSDLALLSLSAAAVRLGRQRAKSSPPSPAGG